ncbi:hypothetical protein NL676_004473 [Syzygium grande]|nr:hypothetical protein NL676_004473 [Syzygium grande]
MMGIIFLLPQSISDGGGGNVVHQRQGTRAIGVRSLMRDQHGRPCMHTRSRRNSLSVPATPVLRDVPRLRRRAAALPARRVVAPRSWGASGVVTVSSNEHFNLLGGRRSESIPAFALCFVHFHAETKPLPRIK